jgi:hypothetical protein
MTPLTVVTPLMAMLIVSASARSDLVVRKLAAVSEAGPARVPKKKVEITLYFPSSFVCPQMSLISNSNNKIVL